MKKLSLLILLSVIVLSCSKSNDDVIPIVPSIYLTPANNQSCAGNVTPQNEIEVNFEWVPFNAQGASLNYTITITNLNTNEVVVSQSTTNTNISIVLDRGVPYSWQISATNGLGVAASGAIWQFQTPGEAVSNHAPFPAKLIAPFNGIAGLLNGPTLTWEGNDPDIGETAQLLYDIYIGASPTSLELRSSNHSETSYSTEALLNGNPGIYYWMIVSKDPMNNKSNSQIWQFQFGN